MKMRNVTLFLFLISFNIFFQVIKIFLILVNFNNLDSSHYRISWFIKHFSIGTVSKTSNSNSVAVYYKSLLKNSSAVALSSVLTWWTESARFPRCTLFSHKSLSRLIPKWSTERVKIDSYTNWDRGTDHSMVQCRHTPLLLLSQYFCSHWLRRILR